MPLDQKLNRKTLYRKTFVKIIPAELSTFNTSTQMHKIGLAKNQDWICTFRLLQKVISQHISHGDVRTQMLSNFNAWRLQGVQSSQQVHKRVHSAIIFTDVKNYKWINVIILSQFGKLSSRFIKEHILMTSVNLFERVWPLPGISS